MYVKPKTFLVGYTTMNMPGLRDYLNYTGQTEFLRAVDEAIESGISLGEILCSFYAKLCYKSLVLGTNANVKRIRDIVDNIEGCFTTGHGSVFEHCWLNFVSTDVSRVFTHELVRHRVGTAFSQTSGRYVAIDNINMVIPPELLAEKELIDSCVRVIENTARSLREKLITESMPFSEKKKITSAIRRIAPNGQTNEIGWSVNIRAIRHLIEMRTSAAAEWEIRHVFNEVADIIQGRYPTMLYGATVDTVDGLKQYKGLKV